MRYAIEVLEPSGNWIELCRVASNPEAIAKAARAKTIKVKHTRRWWRVPQYHGVRVVTLANG